jgi:hypothetical protein
MLKCSTCVKLFIKELKTKYMLNFKRSTPVPTSFFIRCVKITRFYFMNVMFNQKINEVQQYLHHNFQSRLKHSKKKVLLLVVNRCSF